MSVTALQLLAEPKREQILKMVWREERSAGDIAAAFDVSFSAISQHLAVMLQAGLVARRRDGRSQYYKALPEALGPMAAALEQMWFGRLADLKALAEAEQGAIDRSRAARRRAGESRAPHSKGKLHHDQHPESTKPAAKSRRARKRR